MLRRLCTTPIGLATGIILSSDAAAQCPPAWQPGDVEFGVRPSVFSAVRWDPDGPGPTPDWLVIAGDFFEAAGQRANRVAAWDGVAWRTLGAGFPFNRGQLSVAALLVHDGQLIAGGTSESSPGGYVARWDGQAWNQLAPFMLPAVNALCEHQGDVIAGTNQGVARWDGQSWHTLGTSVGYTYALISYSEQLIQATPGLFEDPVVWRWDGAAWRSMSAGLVTPFQSYYVSSLHEHGGDLFATGDVGTPELEAPSVVRWNGERWEGLYTQWPSFFYCSALGSYGGELITAASDINGRCSLMAWNGIAWRRLAMFPTTTGSATVLSLVPYPDRLIMGGYGTVPLATGLATWDGAAVAPLEPAVGLGLAPSSGYTASHLKTLDLMQGRLVAGGVFSRVLGQDASGLAIEQGTGWRAPAGNPLASVTATARCGDRLIVAGRPLGGSSPSSSQVVSWDGTTFSALGAPLLTSVISAACWGARPGRPTGRRFDPGSPILGGAPLGRQRLGPDSAHGNPALRSEGARRVGGHPLRRRP